MVGLEPTRGGDALKQSDPALPLGYMWHIGAVSPSCHAGVLRLYASGTNVETRGLCAVIPQPPKRLFFRGLWGSYSLRLK